MGFTNIKKRFFVFFHNFPASPPMEFMKSLFFGIGGISFSNLAHEVLVFFIYCEGTAFQSDPHPVAGFSADQCQHMFTTIFEDKVSFAKSTARQYLHCIGTASIGFNNSNNLLLISPVFPEPIHGLFARPITDGQPRADMPVEISTFLKIFRFKRIGKFHIYSFP